LIRNLAGLGGGKGKDQQIPEPKKKKVPKVKGKLLPQKKQKKWRGGEWERGGEERQKTLSELWLRGDIEGDEMGRVEGG